MMTQHEQTASGSSAEAPDPERQAELLATFGEKALHLWHDARHPHSLLMPTTVATVCDADGNRISIALGIYGETIVETDFDAEGCPSIMIAAATAAHWAHGKGLDEAAVMTHRDIPAILGDFPREARAHARLAVEAVQEAVARWQHRAN